MNAWGSLYMKNAMIAAAALAVGTAAGGAVELVPGATLHGFSVRSVTSLPEVKGRLVRMTYEKNGADLAWLDRDDDNMTFAIMFRTVPDDDTGVAHIIEHSVLCGSEKYPVKEPFVEMLKSSFSTYLNAWTASDCTTYPVCSRNKADFLNLTDVYLDAVFHPLSVKSPLQFRQEGWHYEINGEWGTGNGERLARRSLGEGGGTGNGELTRNGVVMSEMKGSFGNPRRLARHEVDRLLFPDNCYGRCSGGYPASIHDLTFEKYKEFYFRHYHPSNARIFLDGRVDLPAMLAKLDSFLSAYGRREIDAPIPLQKPVSAEKTIQYEIGEDDSAADKTILMDGWVYGTWRDREEALALDVLSDALADSNEAPIKKALLGKGLCEDVDFRFDGSEAQMCAFLFVKNVKDGKADEVRRTVRETLGRIVAEGLDRRRIAALIDRSEFYEREQDTGGFPRGLVNVYNARGLWLYGGDPADAFRTEHLYKSLRERISQGWFESLLKRAILDNPHYAKLTMTPSTTLGAERRRAEKAELAAILAKWSKEELSRVKEEARALEDFQTKGDSPEDLAKLPALSLSDIPEKGPVPEWAEADAGGTRVFRVKTSANGIAYLDLYFELRGCSREELSDAAILADALGDLPTAKRGLQELKNELDANLGRFDAGVKAFARQGDAKNSKAYLVVHVSALESKLGEIARLVPEVLLETSFDAKLTGDLVNQRRRSIEQSIAGGRAYHYASLRAAASQSALGSAKECLGGISFLRRLQAVDDSFENCGEAFCRRLSSLSERVFARRGLTAFVSDNVEVNWLETVFARFPQGAPSPDVAILPMPARREGFRTTGKIAGTSKASFPGVCTGSGRVAARMLSLGYLWSEIRVLGGAYGGQFGIDTSGLSRYASWNDPNPARTFGVYDRSGDALRKAVRESPSLDKYIIGTVAGTEPYLTPSVEMSSAAALALSGRTPDDVQRLRSEMLHTTKAELMRFADTLDSLTNSPAICVVGGTAQVDACTNLLDKVESVAR